MIQELHAGDRQIPASGWNEMRAAVQGITPGQQQYNSSQRSPVYITVKNATGFNLPAFSVVKLGGATYSRTGDTFINQAIANGVELDGDTPTAPTDVIAVIQEDCPVDGFVKAIVSGVTPARVILDAGVISAYSPYMYATVNPNSNSLLITNDVTPVRVLYLINDRRGYVIINNNDDRQRFIIHCTGSNGLASVAKKGAVFKIWQSSNGWEVTNIQNIHPYHIYAVCQEDIPDGFTGYYSMPFYTPEQNYGAAPTVAVSSGITTSSKNVGRRGVGVGDYEFSNKRLDYCYAHGKYTYEPRFTYTGAAIDRGSTANSRVGIVIEGHTYAVTFPARASSSGLAMMAPDVYAGDTITVLVEENYTGDYSASVTAIEYPTDAVKGTTIMVPSDYIIANRGWQDTTSQGVQLPANTACYTKVQGNALT